MSENSLRKTIFENFSQKETDELIQIWQENKRNEWSDTTFDVIEQILRERCAEIPPQNEPQFEASDQDAEETEPEEQSLPGSQPVFYKPQELLFYADATSTVAWVILAVYIAIGLWYFFSNLAAYSNSLFMLNEIISFFSRILSGVFSFFFLRGISFILRVLMEFEFNSRGVK